MIDVFARGEALRELRDSKGLSQMTVEVEAGIGLGSLSKIELGVRENPSFDTLDKILTAMDATYRERKSILEKFSYKLPDPLPSSDEMKEAEEIGQPILDELPVPAYLIDCATRVITWNALLSATFGLLRGPKSIVERLHNKPLFTAYFDPQLELHRYINDSHEFLAQSIASLRQVLLPYQNTNWYPTLIEEYKNKSPEFREYWDAAQYAELLEVNIRSTIQLQFSVISKGKINFKFASDPFPKDPRFRIIQWMPYDAHTWMIIDELNSKISHHSDK